MRLRHTLLFAVAGLACLGGSTQLLAGSNESQDAVEPRVIQAITQMATYFDGADRISFKAWTTTEDVSSTLQKLQFDTVIKGAIERPNKVFLERVGADSGTMWFDGTTAVILDKDENKYVKIPVTGGLDELIDKLDDLGIEAPLAGLLRGGMLEHVKKQVFKGDYYGESLLGDIKTHHLAMRQDTVDWQLWIDQATNAPRKLVITSKMLAGAPQHQVFIQEINKNPKLPEGTFTVSLPEGATEVPLTESAADQLGQTPW